MKALSRSFVATLLMVLAVSACSRGSAKVELVPVATELRPTPHGYSFANFAASASPEEFNADDLVKMFGSEACAGGVTSPCDPIAEAAAWARMVNQARSSGHCEGIVVEASQRFELSLLPPTVDLVNEGEVTHEIIRTFATQFLPEVQEETIDWGKQSLKKIIGELIESFKTGKAKYSMGLYTDQGGHAVLPYAIEFPTAESARIQLYDSNWPGKNRFVDVDLKAEQWTFSFSGPDPENDPNAWTGGKGYMDLTSLDTRGNSTCPFCASKSKVKNSLIVISSVDTNWSVSNENGSYSPSRNLPVKGITARPIRGSVAPTNYRALEYLVVVEGNALELDLPNTTSAFVTQDNAVLQIAAAAKKDRKITITEGSIAVDDPTVSVKVASGDLVAEASGNNTVVNISETQLNVSVESSTGQKIEVVVNQETPAVSARAVDGGSSNASTNFVVTTQTNDNQVQVREVARDGSEKTTTKVVSEQTDLNSTKIELPPELKSTDVKPGLPPIENRDLKNPEYKADAAFVPTQGLLVTKLAETVVLSEPTTIEVKNAGPETLASFGPTSLPSTTTSTTLAPTTTTTTNLPPTTTTVKPVVVKSTTTTTTSTTTTMVPPTTTTSTTTTTSSTTTTTSSTTTTTTSTTTTTTAPPPPETTTTTTTSTTTTSSTTTTTVAATVASAPTSVIGTAGATQVSLSWTAPPSNGGAAITDYVVQFSTSGSGGFSTFADGTSTSTSATVTGLTNNTVYYFKVAAVNSVGTSDYSTVSSGVRPASLPPVISSVTVGNGSLTFAWNAITHGGDNYRIYWGTDSTFATDYSYTGTTLTTYTVSNLTNGTTYYFRVAGWNNSVTPQIATTNWSTNASGVPLGTRTLTIDSGSYTSSYRMSVSPPTITSTASAGAGTKTYSSSTTSVCTINSSTGVVAFVSVGTCTIGASIAADSSYDSATASTISFSVVYAVGDTGPAGGKIFIIPSTVGNSTGKYFEAAPTSWNGGADPTSNWCNITNGAVGASAQGTTIGTGQGNSTAIGSYCSSGAAVTARAYSGGSLSDWFLPSEDELEALQAVKVTIGGFESASYWSSSEIVAGRSGAFVGPTQEAYPVHFPTGGSNLWYKYQTYHVRPVRMFSPTS
jgi:hypothetical protein